MHTGTHIYTCTQVLIYIHAHTHVYTYYNKYLLKSHRSLLYAFF